MLAAGLALRPGRGDAACLAKRAGGDRPPQTAAELAGHIAAAAARAKTSGLLVFDDTRVTGHPDHRAATGAAALAGHRAGLPVLAWTLPAAVAARLSADTGKDFAGQPPDRIDLCVRVSRARPRRAALLHASQISPGSVL